MTNREKLEKMTDEELGEFLCNLVPDTDYMYDCKMCPAEKKCNQERIALIDWLKAEAEEEA